MPTWTTSWEDLTTPSKWFTTTTIRYPRNKFKLYPKQHHPGDSYRPWEAPPHMVRQSMPAIESQAPEPGLTVSDEPVLDYNSFPHLVDRIASHLPFASLMVWRETCFRYRDLFDIATLHTSIRQLEGGHECVVEVRTGGDYLLTEFSCQVLFNDFVLPAGDRRFQFRDSELQGFFECSRFRNLHVTGSCSHESRAGEGWSYWWIGQRPISEVLYGLMSVGIPPRRVFLSPDSRGEIQLSAARGEVVFFLDNWKVEIDPENWVDPSPRDFGCAMGLAPLPGAWAFLVSGSEGDVPLFRSTVPRRRKAIYDFSQWRRPARFDFGTKRLTSLLEHSRKHLLKGEQVVLCGLEVVDPAWLDATWSNPTYHGDDRSIAPASSTPGNTSAWPRWVPYLGRGLQAADNTPPSQTFTEYIRQRVAAAVPECQDVHLRILVQPAHAGSTDLYGMHDESRWGPKPYVPATLRGGRYT